MEYLTSFSTEELHRLIKWATDIIEERKGEV